MKVLRECASGIGSELGGDSVSEARTVSASLRETGKGHCWLEGQVWRRAKSGALSPLRRHPPNTEYINVNVSICPCLDAAIRSGTVLVLVDDDGDHTPATPRCRLYDDLCKGGFRLRKVHRRDVYRRSQEHMQSRIREIWRMPPPDCTLDAPPLLYE